MTYLQSVKLYDPEYRNQCFLDINDVDLFRLIEDIEVQEPIDPEYKFWFDELDYEA